MNNKNLLSFAFQWHITSYCSNCCKHCYMYDKNHVLHETPHIEELLEIYSKIKDFEDKYHVSMNNYILTGGDPLSSPYFWNLVEYLDKDKRHISILGIPEQVNEKNIVLMEKYNIKYYQVSIDGIEKIHDDIRGQGSYQRTIEAIKQLSRTSISVAVMYTLHEMNEHAMFQVIDDIDRLNVKVTFAFDFLVEEGNAAKNTDCKMISPEKVDSIFEKYIAKADELKRKHSKIELVMKNKLLALKSGIKNGQRRNSTMKVYPYVCGCYNGFTSATILQNGDVQPCRRMNVAIGNLHHMSFEEIFLGNKLLRKMRRREYYELCSDCKYYEFCRGCSAVAMSFSEKNPFAKNPYCIYKEPLERTKKIYQCPKLTCSNEEELQFIQDIYKNKLLAMDEAERIRELFNIK